jgi:ubiquinone/menaquinone biosynthesis C-methylase UbiE
MIKLRSNCEDIPIEDKSISLCMCIDIIEHVIKPNLVLSEVARISNFAIFKIPLELSLFTFFAGNRQRLKKLKSKYGHIHHFNRRSLLRLIEENFEVLHEGYEKIPNRWYVLDKLQDVLIALGLKGLFAFIFGGFIILVVRSKTM